MEYLTIKEASQLMRVSENTIRTWIKENKIKYIRIDKAIRIPKEQFIAK